MYVLVVQVRIKGKKRKKKGGRGSRLVGWLVGWTGWTRLTWLAGVDVWDMGLEAGVALLKGVLIWARQADRHRRHDMT